MGGLVVVEQLQGGVGGGLLLGGGYEEEGITKRRAAAAQGHFLPQRLYISCLIGSIGALCPRFCPPPPSTHEGPHVGLDAIFPIARQF